jgi:hypothetical protein
VLASPENLARLRLALADLRAELIAVPPLEVAFLDRGHAVHFRCTRPDAAGLRIDVMSRMRGVEPFERLWERRTTLQLDTEGETVELDLLSLPDLVAAKKTQRDKDWPMLRRLLEANYLQFRRSPNPPRVTFWLRELRTPELLIECAQHHRAHVAVVNRPAAEAALARDESVVQERLAAEQAGEMELDRQYWAPLRRELERLRQDARRHGGED